MVQPDQVSCVCEPRFRSPASTPAGARAERQRRQRKPEQRRRPPLPLVPPGHATPPSCYLLARVATPPARFSCCISSLGAACYPFASADPARRATAHRFVPGGTSKAASRDRLLAWLARHPRILIWYQTASYLHLLEPKLWIWASSQFTEGQLDALPA